MPTMTEHIDHNFYKHSWMIPEQTRNMQVVHAGNLTYVNSGLSCDTFNIIHIHDQSGIEEKEITEAIEYFKSRNLDYCIWVSSENLSEKVKHAFELNSVSQQNEEAGMVLMLEKYQPTNRDQHANIKIVDSELLLQNYSNVIAENWTPPDQNVISYFEQTAEHYLNPANRIVLLVYYHEGSPVSTVEMFPSDDETIGLYGFATLATHRGLGIGTSLMTFGLNKAKELGYKQAILQASEDGIGIYRRFGFEELTTYYEYA